MLVSEVMKTGLIGAGGSNTGRHGIVMEGFSILAWICRLLQRLRKQHCLRQSSSDQVLQDSGGTDPGACLVCMPQSEGGYKHNVLCATGGKELPHTTSILRLHVMLCTPETFRFGVIHDPPVVSMHAMVTPVQMESTLLIKMSPPPALFVASCKSKVAHLHLLGFKENSVYMPQARCEASWVTLYQGCAPCFKLMHILQLAS
jgi:hypothetical protein